jgi:hypothetical protein
MSERVAGFQLDTLVADASDVRDDWRLLKPNVMSLAVIVDKALAQGGLAW